MSEAPVPEDLAESWQIIQGMLMIMKRLGFRTQRHPEEATVVRATLELRKA